MKKINVGNLKISSNLLEFINNEAIPGTEINANIFWSKFEKSVHFLAPINRKLLETREKIQKKNR